MTERSAPIPGSNPASKTGRVLSHLSIQLVLYSVNSINAIPDIPSPQVRGLFPLVYERKTSEKNSARSCSAASFEKWNQWNIRLYSPINTGKSTFHFLIQKVEQATRSQKQKKGRTRQEREPLTHFDTLRSVSEISRIHRPPRAIARFPDTLPFFIVCRYFRRIYRLPRTLDTLNTLFFQPTRTEKFFPYISIYLFFLSRALVQKKVCQVCQMVVLPDEHGKSTDTLKFSQVCQKSATFPYSPINWGKF